MRIMFATSIPSSVVDAETKDLKPSIGLIRLLMVRWSCSTNLRGIPGDPPIERRVVHLYAALRQDLFLVPIRHRVADIEEDSEKDHILRKLCALE